MSIKKILKKSNFLRFVKQKYDIFLGKLFPKAVSKKRFKQGIGRRVNLINPSSLNDKLMFYKFNLYWNNDLVSLCADKFSVRNYVNEVGCGKYLIPLYGSWDKVEDIDWDKLPSKFVIKCNHGSGYNIICRDKEKFDISAAKNKLQKWMKENYGFSNAEQGIYSKIDKKIIAEKFIETPDGLPPHDYKFFCSYGKVKLLFVASDRYENMTKFDYYYPDWTWIPVKNSHPNNGFVDKPENYDEMIKVVEKISKPFPLVRVDLYNVDGNIIFGEITFTHFGCVHPFDPPMYDEEFGKLFPDVNSAKYIKYEGNCLSEKKKNR